MKDPLPEMLTSKYQFLPQLNNVSGNNTNALFYTWYFRIYQIQPNQIFALYGYWVDTTSVKVVTFQQPIFNNSFYGKWVHMVSLNLIKDSVLIYLRIVIFKFCFSSPGICFLFFWKFGSDSLDRKTITHIDFSLNESAEQVMYIVCFVFQALVFDRNDEVLKLYINAILKAQSSEVEGPFLENMPSKNLNYRLFSRGICTITMHYIQMDIFRCTFWCTF